MGTIVTEKRKILSGEVVSDKMNKTVVVRVERRYRHPVFKKIIRKHDRYKVHDGNNECTAGDKINIVECRPLSKDKRWRLLEIVKKAEVAEVGSGK
jgi:small subunit ribosomal protein S17